ncbi:hypothetical protein JW905_08550 [bacterium]|nr:hypothetical protein [candidate division CSSED10-310 bacterium]
MQRGERLAFVWCVLSLVSLLGFARSAAQDEPAATEQTTQEAPAAETRDEIDVNIKDMDMQVSLPSRELIIFDPKIDRDPFDSLIKGLGPENPPGGNSPNFIPISDLTLKGIMRVPNGYLAIFMGVNGKSYLLKEGDRVYDGTIMRIEENKVVFKKPIYTIYGTVKKTEIIEIPLHM